MNKSALFSVYNKAARCDQLNRKVVNRALGIVQRGTDTIKPQYHTTIQHCDCPSRIQPCKHRVALMLVKRSQERARIDVTDQAAIELANARYFVAEYRRYVQNGKQGLSQLQPGTQEYNRIAEVLTECREQLKRWRSIVKNCQK
jgi:hypothetical protein